MHTHMQYRSVRFVPALWSDMCFAEERCVLRHYEQWHINALNSAPHKFIFKIATIFYSTYKLDIPISHSFVLMST